MSDYLQELKAVDAEIKALRARRLDLRKKQKKNELDSDDMVALEDLVENYKDYLTKLEKDKIFWQDLVQKNQELLGIFVHF